MTDISHSFDITNYDIKSIYFDNKIMTKWPNTPSDEYNIYGGPSYRRGQLPPPSCRHPKNPPQKVQIRAI